MTGTKTPTEWLFVRLAPGDPLVSQIGERSGCDGLPHPDIVTLGVRRYFAFLEAELARIHLSTHEAVFLCNVLRGACYRYDPEWTLLESVMTAIHSGLAKGWTDEMLVALTTRVAAITPSQAIALLDAVERFWIRCDPHQVTRETLMENLRAVGLKAGKGA